MNGLIRAAGGVLWRPAETPSGEPGVEVTVIHRPRYDDWSLPKGKLAPGESEVDAAVREVLEETGFRVRIGRPLGESRYLKVTDGVEQLKVVHWWAMQAVSGAFVPNVEVDQLSWLSLDAASARLGRDSERVVLERFTHGPPPELGAASSVTTPSDVAAMR